MRSDAKDNTKKLWSFISIAIPLKNKVKTKPNWMAILISKKACSGTIVKVFV